MSMQRRSTEAEWMDDAGLDTPLLDKTLHEIAFLNRFLGGHRSVIRGVKKIVRQLGHDKNTPVSLLDLGCGLGDCLSALSDSMRGSLPLKLTGIDMNRKTLEMAAIACAKKGIVFRQMEMNATRARELEADIVMCNLFLHHFTDEDIRSFLQSIDPKKVRALLINDLQRSRMSLFLYKLVSRILNLNPMARNDGAISIRKGFRFREWQSYFSDIPLRKLTISRQWAFRHQIIVLF